MRTSSTEILRSRLLLSVAAFVAAATPALAVTSTANETPANVNVLNLLAPFLGLNGTSIGQSTLTLNLAQALSINNNASLVQEELAYSDKNLLGSVSNSVTGIAGVYGVAANLGGSLPNQPPPAGGSVPGIQPVGGLGPVLGSLYDTGVNGYAATSTALKNTATLLANAYSFTSSDLGAAKNYFANGTIDGTNAAVAPAGYTLPTANGLPNKSNSVYDVAYGVKNSDPAQNVYGDSRPVQIVPGKVNQFDPTAISGLTTNPSFPSGHSTYAYTDSILLAMLVPQEYQSMLSRGSEFANSRIVLGVHYPLDVIGSRSLASYDLAQALTNPALYQQRSHHRDRHQPARPFQRGAG